VSTEEQAVSSTAKKLSAYNLTRIFVTVFKTACHFSRSQMYPAQGHPSYFFAIHFNIILPLLSGLQQIYCNEFKVTNQLTN